MARRTYLSKMDPDVARRELFARIRWPETPPAERVPAEEAAGRVTAEPVIARWSSPAFPAAAMDGIAVAAATTAGVGESRPRRLVAGKDAFEIDTGDPLPAGADAVIMAEHAPEVGPGVYEIHAAVPPWQHVRLVGEDIVTGELLCTRGRRITPALMAAMLAAGHEHVAVVRRPRIVVVPTGDEVVTPALAQARGGPAVGQIVETNARMIAAMAREWGAEAVVLPPLGDDGAALEACVRHELREADAVVVNAGSSAGRDDNTPALLQSLGELVCHGVNVMPGKPTALGVAQGKPIFGLPGYPVSAAVAAELFVKPFVERFLGVHLPARPRVTATLARKVASRPGNEEIVRVFVGRVGDHLTAVPLARGAGVITSLARASGLLSIPARSEGFDQGARVEVKLLLAPEEVERAVVCIGSHDLLIDVVADRMRALDPLSSIVSGHVGSLGGLLALAQGQAHLAGCHLIDPKSGIYTLPFVREHLAQMALRVVRLAGRVQGIYVRPGNPKSIRTFADLARPDVTFVNRQKGAGTRMLLDLRLLEAGIDPASVRGYEREQPTHMAVAAAVASGLCDAALGIEAAARAVGLGFVALETEPYDLVVPETSLAHPGVALLLETIGGAAFRAAASRLPGYDLSESGRVVAQLGPAR